MNIRLIAGLTLAMALTGCNLIELVVPKNADLGMSLKAPTGNNAVATINAGSYTKTLTDDSKGLVRTLSIPSGPITIQTTVIAGYTSRIAVSNSEGNISYSDKADFVLKSGEAVSVAIDYSAPSTKNNTR